jgi:SAM-dependent methyltransferase
VILKKILQRLRRELAMRIDFFSDADAIRKAVARKREAGKPVLVNLGCGAQLHPDWTNIDFHGDGKTVYSWDLRKALPLPDRCCDAVYASHVIEHFGRDAARHFLLECRRVLKADGCIRLVAPDLEATTRFYLTALEDARRGDPGAAQRYDWMALEMLDQLVRHRSGGEMMNYWSQEQVPAEEFVAQRVGSEYWRARKYCISAPARQYRTDAAAVGKFRLGGEVHLWMYDSYSLGRLLIECGYAAPRQCSATESSINGFSRFGLDTEVDGSVYKPDSFFIEAGLS